jgi:hypothetical protein
MQTFRAIGRYLKENGGTVAAIRKVSRLSWAVLSESGLKRLIEEIRNTLRVKQGEVEKIRRRTILATLASRKKITILATAHTLYVAYMLDHALVDMGFQVSVITSPPLAGYGDDVYIVLCPQMFSRLPKNLISFQMEQSSSSRWFTQGYLDNLRTSLAVLDYSRTNIGFLEQQGIPYSHIFYMPITKIPNYLEFLAAKGLHFEGVHQKEYEVLFYGDINNARRRMILDKLRDRFDVKVIGNLFGQELYRYLLAARVIVNIHYYETALLETTRICECLSLGIPVVSESTLDRAEYPELESQIRFVEMGDVAGMIEAIEVLLSTEIAAPKAQIRAASRSVAGEAASSFHLNRFLLACGVLDLKMFSDNDFSFPPSFATGRICLSLPETPARRASFLSRKLTDFEIFDGLRHTQGWIGCALSYKFLIQQAKKTGLRQVLICEDDVVLDQKGEAALSVAEEYLDSLNGEWDIFVGLVSHIHPDVEISQVVEVGGLTFVHLNKMTGMVLNIYNHTIYDRFGLWSELNEDPKTNTIDRYLENIEGLRVITTIPFIVGHSEDDSSTLWGFGNESYAGLIARSQELLQVKVDMFLAKENRGD